MTLGSNRVALLVLGMVAVAGGCAHVEAPPGGPEDSTPPRLLLTRPDTLAVVRGMTTPVVFAFDERISEQQVREVVSVSPRTSPVAVDHRGNELRVSLRGGWQPNTIYHVTVEPGLSDLFGNRITEMHRVIFSTGGEIPDTRLEGDVVDRITGRPEMGVRVEAIRGPDSLVYAVPSDSAGRFLFERVPEGQYQIRAFRDLNRNRSLEPFEPRDTASARVVAGEPSSVSLAVLMPDSTPAAIASVSNRERRVEIRTDDYLDPAQQVAVEQVEIVGPDGAVVPIESVALDGQAAPGIESASDRALPTQTLLVTLPDGAVLTPGQRYVARIRGIRNVNGLIGDSELAWLAAESP